jgi:hypothetical protein
LIRPAATAGLALLATACGGAPKVSPPASSQEVAAQVAAYASCLRSHGVAAAVQPDGTMLIAQTPETRASTQSAEQDCRSLLPPGGLPGPTKAQLAARLARDLKFASCMRAHGVPAFPDPSSHGGIDITPSMGIDASSPRFRSAQRSCRVYAPVGLP